MPPFPFRPFVPPLLILLLVGCAGEGRQAVEPTATGPATPPAKQSVELPEAPILFQPQFLWADARLTREGTGFFAVGPRGQVVGISSVQYLRSQSPALLEASWLGVRTDEPVVTFTRHWGEPGAGGSMQPLNLRGDYLLLPAKRSYVPSQAVLELDARPAPERGERVWLPVKAVDSPHGYRPVQGKVISKDTQKFVVVDLGEHLALASLNGSPVISQRTGKVVGALSRGGEIGDRTLLILTPAEALREAIAAADETIPLEEAFEAKKETAAHDKKQPMDS